MKTTDPKYQAINAAFIVLLTTVIIGTFAGYAYMMRAYDCTTDIECEIEEAKRCLIFCEA